MNQIGQGFAHIVLTLNDNINCSHKTFRLSFSYPESSGKFFEIKRCFSNQIAKSFSIFIYNLT